MWLHHIDIKSLPIQQCYNHKINGDESEFIEDVIWLVPSIRASTNS